MNEHIDDPAAESPRAGEPAGWDRDPRSCEHATLRGATVHGIWPYNAGSSHEPHARFESVWPSANESYRQGGGFEPPATSL
jgi:hypothetical protein